MQTEKIIELEHICHTYRTKSGEVKALNDISLSILRGEFVAVIGQSGSGKSTMMNILGCLDTMDSGRYLLSGTDISKADEKTLTRIRSSFIGFVFQSFNLIPTLTAAENVELPLLYRKIPRAERARLSAEALARVGLSERAGHKPNELSGGQQQRTAIARAVALQPELLLADEPTGSLDRASGEEILGIMKELNRNGVTVVLITHDESIAARAGRRIRIIDGKLVSVK